MVEDFRHIVKVIISTLSITSLRVVMGGKLLTEAKADFFTRW